MAWIRLKQLLPNGRKFDAPINADAITRVGYVKLEEPDGPSFIRFTDGDEIEVEEPLAKIWKLLSTGGM